MTPIASTLRRARHPRRRRRGTELFLLVLALVVGVGAYATVGLGRDGRGARPDILGYGGWLGRCLSSAATSPCAVPRAVRRPGAAAPRSSRSTASAWP